MLKNNNNNNNNNYNNNNNNNNNYTSFDVVEFNPNFVYTSRGDIRLFCILRSPLLLAVNTFSLVRSRELLIELSHPSYSPVDMLYLN